MDESTRVSLQKAINSGLVDSYGGIIATGKEAVVIHATGGTSKPEEFQDCLPAEMAVKGFPVLHFYIILELILIFFSLQNYIERIQKSSRLYSRRLPFQRSFQKNQSTENDPNVVRKRII